MRVRIIWMGLLVLILFASQRAAADSLVSMYPGPDYPNTNPTQTDSLPAKITDITYPTLGFPSIVAHGDSLTIWVSLANSGSTSSWSIFLEPVDLPISRQHGLAVLSSTFDPISQAYMLTVPITPAVPADTYDLIVTSPDLPNGTDRQYQSVRVVNAILDDFRFVHMADSQVQDFRVTNSTIIYDVLKEIRLVDPVFCLYSGDLNFGDDYVDEYSSNHTLFRSIGVPLFMAPGNHDGYATTIPTGVFPPSDPPGELSRDGLNYWRSMIGPTDFSFDYGKFHFISINTYSGSAKRRNSIRFWVTNFGGDMNPSQLQWLEDDLRKADMAGKEIVMFGHHDFSQPVSPSKDAYPFPWRPPDTSQDWNGASSQAIMLRLIADYNVSHVLLGHWHSDYFHEVTVNQGTPAERKVKFIATTTTNVGSNGWGYRVIDVIGGKIARWDYKPVQGQGSIPFDVGGNFDTSFLTPNDGTGPLVRAQVQSSLERDMTVTLDLHLQSANKYKVSGGRLRAVADTPGISSVQVEVDVLALGTSHIQIEPDTSGGGSTGGGSTGGGGGSTGGGSTGSGGGHARAGSSASSRCGAHPGILNSSGVLGWFFPYLILAIALLLIYGGGPFNKL